MLRTLEREFFYFCYTDQMNTFYIVRHGETENNRSKRLSGWIDTPLTENGLKPTDKVIAKLAHLQIDEVYSSDMGRAFITAYKLVRGLQFPKEIKHLSGLREVNYGDAANMFSAKAYELYHKLDRDTHYAPPNGESLDHMQKRVFQTIDELNERHKDAVIVLVCHSGVMAALRASHIGQDFGEHNISEAYPHDYVGKFTFANGVVTGFEEFKG
jgi:broad specificity phosphatase PhoE